MPSREATRSWPKIAAFVADFVSAACWLSMGWPTVGALFFLFPFISWLMVEAYA